MKKTLQRCFIILASVLVLGAGSCKKKLKDADIQASIESVISADADMKGMMVTVKDGVATLSGECKDEALKAKFEEAIKKVEGVKSVINNSTIAVVAPVVPPASDALAQAVTDALKDFPGVKSQLTDGVLTLTGEIKRTSLQKLMMGLNALKSIGLKKIESAGLVKN
ncbi:MAG: BON domain-containing protein [Lacibacter sp.]|nr:BON domain-containing protein [Lacibacter sp.]